MRRLGRHLVSADRLPLLRERDQVVLQEVWVDPRDLPRIPSQLCLAEVSGRVSSERRNAGLRPVLGEEDVRLGVEVVVQIGRPDYLFVYRREQERILLMERPPSEGDPRRSEALILDQLPREVLGRRVLRRGSSAPPASVRSARAVPSGFSSRPPGVTRQR